MSEMQRVTLRLPDDLVQYVDRKVDEATAAGKRMDRTSFILTCIRHRQIMDLPEETREALLYKLGVRRSAPRPEEGECKAK